MWAKGKYVAIIVVVALLDQLTKAWVLNNLRGKPPIVLWQDATSGQVWFELTFVTNTGAAWGIFAGHTEYLAALSAVMILVMGWVLVQARKDEVMLSVALSLMLGGAFGNLLDRMIHQYVTDFLHVYLPIGGIVHWLSSVTQSAALMTWEANTIRNGVYDFPIFNIADSAVVVGTCLLLIALMKPSPEQETEAELGLGSIPEAAEEPAPAEPAGDPLEPATEATSDATAEQPVPIEQPS